MIYTLFFLGPVNFCCLFLAILLNKNMPGRNIFRAITYYPQALACVLVALIWGWMFNAQFGLFNGVLRTVGLGFLARDWLGETNTAFCGIMITGAWQSVGAGVVFFLSGLQTIPNEIYEASRIDGAKKLQTFIKITIPMLKETFVIVVTLTIISTMKVYDIVFAMTGGGPARTTNVLASWMFSQSFVYGHLDMGAAIAWVLFAIIAIFAIPYVLVMSRESE